MLKVFLLLTALLGLKKDLSSSEERGHLCRRCTVDMVSGQTVAAKKPRPLR